MTRNDLNTVFTAKVTELLAKGYTINTNTMSGSQGEYAHVDLRKGDDLVRVLMDTERAVTFDLVLAITVGRVTEKVDPLDTRATIWNSQLETIDKEMFIEKSFNNYEVYEAKGE